MRFSDSFQCKILFQRFQLINPFYGALNYVTTQNEIWKFDFVMSRYSVRYEETVSARVRQHHHFAGFGDLKGSAKSVTDNIFARPDVLHSVHHLTPFCFAKAVIKVIVYGVQY